MPKSTEEIYKDLLAQGKGYQQQADSLLEQINNRPAFSYNAETDPMYQSVKNQYVHQGQRAMQDTMGQAAGLTGGYGSSYAQAAGNQAYNEYLTKLNEQIPVLAQQARQAYDAEGDALRDRYNLALNAANNAYNQGRDALGDVRYEEERDYNRQQTQASDARNYATYLLGLGIMPSNEQLSAAGISPQEAASIRNYYLQQQYAAGGTGGAGGSGSSGGRSGGSGGGRSGSGRSGGGGTGSSSGGTETQGTSGGEASRSLLPGGGFLGINDILNNGLNAVYDAIGAPRNSVPQNDLVDIARLYATKGGDAALAELRRRYGNGYDLDTAWAWISNNWKRYGPSGQLAGYSRGERSFDFTT